MKTYVYVGPDDIRRRAESAAPGAIIASRADLSAWIRSTGQASEGTGWIAATFVIDAAGRLRLADRHSEHVACAAGGPVISAGEVFLEAGRRGTWAVAEISNLSTGFCPEPESWPGVASALEAAELSHPGRFTTEIVFRRCPDCRERNVVRDGWFVCALCGADLPRDWNFA